MQRGYTRRSTEQATIKVASSLIGSIASAAYGDGVAIQFPVASSHQAGEVMTSIENMLPTFELIWREAHKGMQRFALEFSTKEFEATTVLHVRLTREARK